MTASTQTIPPILCLPTELRFLIYEAIPLTRRHQTISPHLDPGRALGAHNPAPACVHLVTTSISTSILSTCRFPHDEAKVILGPRLQALRLEPPGMIIESFGYDPNPEDTSIPNYVLARVAQVVYGNAENMTEALYRNYRLQLGSSDYLQQTCTSPACRKIEREKLGISEDFSGAMLRTLVISTPSKPVSVMWTYNHRYRYYRAAFDLLDAALSLQLPVTVQYRESNLDPLSEREKDSLRNDLLRRFMLRNIEYTEPIDEEEWASKWASSESAEMVEKAE